MSIDLVIMFGIISLIVLVVGIVIVIGSKEIKQTSNQLDKISEVLGGTGNAFYRKATLDKYNLWYGMLKRGGGKNAPRFFAIRLLYKPELHFEVTEEKSFDTFGKNIGLTKEIQTGDHDFDCKFFLSSKNDRIFKKFISESANRELIEILIKDRFDRVEVTEKGITLWAKSGYLQGCDTATVQEVVQNLTTLADSLSEFAKGQPKSELKLGVKRVFHWSFVLAGLIDLAGLALFILGLVLYLPLDIWEVIKYSLSLSLPLLGLFVVFLYKFVAGSSNSHRMFVLWLVFSVPMILIGVFGAVSAYNGFFDSSPAEKHYQEIVKLYKSRSKKSQSYHIVVKSWREGHETESIQVGYSTYHQYQEGQPGTLVVETKPGSLGYEWLYDYHPLQ